MEIATRLSNEIARYLDLDTRQIQLTSANMANASNTTYTRQVPNWSENQPVTINGVAYGSGVTVTGGISQRDRVLEQRLQQQQQLGASSSALLTALTTLQANFSTASSGSSAGNIGSDITGFFNAYSELEASPVSNPLRQQVLSAAQQLAGDISAVANSINAQQASIDQSVNTVVAQVNSITQSLGQINKQIQSISPNQDAGALEDQRQSDLTQLSQLMGFNQITTEQNGLSVATVSGQLLVSESASIPITTGSVNGVTHLFVGNTDITNSVTAGGGQVGGCWWRGTRPFLPLSPHSTKWHMGLRLTSTQSTTQGRTWSGTMATPAIFSMLPLRSQGARKPWAW